jgi:DnaJ-domain-containing protein 1
MFRFQENFYTSSIEEKQLQDQDLVLNLQFQYGNTNYKNFSEKYRCNTKLWIGRKISALPLAIWSATVKMIYHLAKALFLGPLFFFIPEKYVANNIPYSDEGRYLKSQIFHIGRDLQESLGRLVSLFDDRYGLYLIQESQFHAACYDYLENVTYSTLRISMELVAKKINNLTTHDNLVPLDKSVHETGQSGDVSEYPQFLDNDSITNEYVKQLFSDRPWKREETIDRLANLSDDDFKKIAKRFSNSHFSLIPGTILESRLNLVDYDSITNDQIEYLFPVNYLYGLHNGLPIKGLIKLSDENFKKAAKKFSDNHFSLIPDSILENRLNLLDYDSITNDQIERLFPINFNEPMKRFSKLSDENFKKIAKKFSNMHFHFITKRHIHLLDYAQLTKEQVDWLFPLETSEEHHKSRMKFSKLSSNQAYEILDHLSRDRLDLISEKHLSDSNLKAKYEDIIQFFATHHAPAYFTDSMAANYSRSQFIYDGGERYGNYSVHYKMLGLNPTASKKEIRNAYKTLIRTHHPDRITKNVGESVADFEKRKKESEEKFKKISASYEVLTGKIKITADS